MPEIAVQSRLTATRQLTIARLPENQRTVLEQDENGEVQIYERPFLAQGGGLAYNTDGQLMVASGGTGGTSSTPGAAQW